MRDNASPRVWALVPARGGSKSIPLKNLAPLGGRPLLDYGILATQGSGCAERILCSTDDAAIASRAAALGVEVDLRPAALGGDEVAVAEVARELLGRQTQPLPDLLLLVQPTSAFLLPEQIRALVAALAAAPDAHSGQTVTPVPHNFHAWNQRVVEHGQARFRFAAERRQAYNKQRKPKLHVFGNLVAVRPAALLAGQDFFAEPSVAVEIPWPYSFDVDSADDLALAELLLRGGRVPGWAPADDA